jgi:hypothetical protein
MTGILVNILVGDRVIALLKAGPPVSGETSPSFRQHLFDSIQRLGPSRGVVNKGVLHFALVA